MAPVIPRFAPQFEIAISGKPLPAALRAAIIKVSYQDGLEGADRVEITIANDGLRRLEDPLLQVDNKLTLSIGYAPDSPERVFVGEITGVGASFPNSGMPTVTVVAHDFLQRLTAGSRDRAFQIPVPCIGSFPLPDPAVVALVAGVDLLIPKLDPVGAALSFLTLLLAYAIDPLDAKKAVRIQQGESDFDFLSKVARENGWEMYIDHQAEPQGYRLRFQFLMGVQDYKPSVRLVWGASLIEFNPRVSTVGQVFGISTRIWVSAIKMEFVIVLSWDFDKGGFSFEVYPGLGSLDAVLGGKKAQGVLRVDAVGPASAPKQILSELLPRLNSRITATGSTMGDPRIKAGKVVDVAGIGDPFGGLYRVTTATHTLDSGGYRTQFDLRKEVWFGGLAAPKGAGGLLRVQGQAVR